MQARLLKNQAIATYRRLLALYPDYRDADKVLFFMAHEMRELGEYDNMLKTYHELADKHPQERVPPRGAADRRRLLLRQGRARPGREVLQHGDRLARDPGPRHGPLQAGLVQDQPRRLQGGAQAVRGLDQRRPQVGSTGSKAASTERQQDRSATRGAGRLGLLLHRGPQARRAPWSTSSKRADSKTTYLAALDKLGNRYYVKQNWKATAMVYREILSLTGDIEDSLEYAHRLFEAVTNGKLYDHGAEDVARDRRA